MKPLRADELAAFLGMTTSGVRNVISRHKIKPVGKTARAHLYDPREVLAKTGAYDRRST